MKLKLKMSMKNKRNKAAIKKCLILEIIRLIRNNSNKLVIWKMKGETGGVAFEEFF